MIKHLIIILTLLTPSFAAASIYNETIFNESDVGFSKLYVPDVIAGDVVPEMIKEKAKETKKVFEGYAVSSGIVQGRARIIRSPEEFGRFRPGEILVAPTTDPMWSSLFPVAKAVVTEMGGGCKKRHDYDNTNKEYTRFVLCKKMKS